MASPNAPTVRRFQGLQAQPCRYLSAFLLCYKDGVTDPSQAYMEYRDAMRRLSAAQASWESVAKPSMLPLGADAYMIPSAQVEAEMELAQAWRDYESKRDRYYDLLG
jgi:hypothetical protein